MPKLKITLPRATPSQAGTQWPHLNFALKRLVKLSTAISHNRVLPQK